MPQNNFHPIVEAEPVPKLMLWPGVYDMGSSPVFPGQQGSRADAGRPELELRQKDDFLTFLPSQVSRGQMPVPIYLVGVGM